MLQPTKVEFVFLRREEEDGFVSCLENENRKRHGEREKVLMLSFPSEAETGGDAVKEFFQSPTRVNRFSHSFRGIFAVDITEYLKNSESTALGMLRDYTEENGEMDFVLYAFTDREGEAERLSRKLGELYSDSRRGFISKPWKKSGRVAKSGRSFGY